MTKNKRKGTPYTPLPELPEELVQRFVEVMLVIGGAKTMTQAARDLGISRVQCQTLTNRALDGMIEAITPRPSGKKPMSETERALREENQALHHDIEMLEKRIEAMTRFVETASSLFRKGKSPFVRETRSKSTSRSKRTKTQTPPSNTPSTDEEPDPATRMRHEQLACALALGACKLNRDAAAGWAGLSASTMRRWAKRRERGEELRRRPGPRAAIRGPELDAAAHVRELVRASAGSIGAASLAKSAGTSRRQAALLKRQVLTTLERERIAACERIEVTQAGVMRGFDAMYITLDIERAFLLAAADASVPYRTSLALVATYDEESVLAAMERDLDENGEPLVWRMDRASCQRTDRVRALLARRGVLLLHGPPRHPGYYGQLERQNREHRALLAPVEGGPRAAIDPRLAEMLFFLNELYRRPSLGWATAGERWRESLVVRVDRLELRDEVDHTRDRILCHMDDDSRAAWDLAERIAIERMLERRGFLRRRTGAKC